MKYYITYTDNDKTTVRSFGSLTTNYLSTKSPFDWFDTEAELEIAVDAIMGDGYYSKRKEESL